MAKQYIRTGDYGSIYYYKDPEMTIRHREDGPAIEWVDGGKEWYLNGKRHRKDGPALERGNGDREWFLNNKRHRLDGPAIEYGNGEKVWYVNGVFILQVGKHDKIRDRMS